MAYATKEQSKRVKAELKKAYPGYKFSVTVDNSSSINVSIMEAPVRFVDTDYAQLNHYYLGNYKNSDILKGIKEIANKGNFDKSDVMSDYHHVGFYLHINVGKWDKPFVLKTK